MIESKKTIAPKLWYAIIDLVALHNKVKIQFSQYRRCRLFALDHSIIIEYDENNSDKFVDRIESQVDDK